MNFNFNFNYILGSRMKLDIKGKEKGDSINFFYTMYMKKYILNGNIPLFTK